MYTKPNTAVPITDVLVEHYCLTYAGLFFFILNRVVIKVDR